MRVAVHNGAYPSAEKPRAQHADGQYHPQHLVDSTALFGMEQLSKDEKEDQREKIVEEDDGLVPVRQLQRDFGLDKIAVHSRSRLPVSSIKTSSRVGRFKWMSASSIPC